VRSGTFGHTGKQREETGENWDSWLEQYGYGAKREGMTVGGQHTS
jgi:hypothetical protein